MHEMSVTESLLEITLRHAQAANARRVTTLNIVVGKLSSIIDDSVQFYWDILAKDTLAEGARLTFRRIPIRMVCQDCGQEYSPEIDDFSCPQCASQRIKITAGDEFFLESIDVES